MANSSHNISWQLFCTFLRIGAFTLGGGYAMIPQIERDVVERRGWIERSEFLDLIAVAQSCPGVFAVNIATFIGYRLRRTPGALLAALGSALPSFVIILLIAMFFHQFQDVGWVASCFNGIRPAVVALIAAPVFTLAKSAKITFSNCWIPVVSAMLIWLMGVNPIYIIIVAAAGGYVYGLLSDNDESEASSA
ncbi:MAG: chromate transporter [Prevotella sp.]|nr:chromate transporter [Prevotella sp.]